jgi:replicative DNA helicase
LRESSSIEQDADTVLFIHRPEESILISDTSDGAKKNQKIKADWPAELIVAKQRNGSTGRFKLDWDGARTRFSCWDGARTQFSEAEISW